MSDNLFLNEAKHIYTREVMEAKVIKITKVTCFTGFKSATDFDERRSLRVDCDKVTPPLNEMSLKIKKI